MPQDAYGNSAALLAPAGRCHIYVSMIAFGNRIQKRNITIAPIARHHYQNHRHFERRPTLQVQIAPSPTKATSLTGLKQLCKRVYKCRLLN
jgi:hypothetical protein